jgi:Lrp/AsnC family leucine-responsive transcriptional regulator
MAEQIDDLDRAILDILQKDGRTPASQIAEQVGLSRPAVAERMEKLERARVILGTTTVVSPVATGFNVTAFVSARRAGYLDAKAAKALETFTRKKEVLEMHTVAGDDCYLMKLRTDSIQSLNGLVNSLTREPLSMVTRTTIVMETHCEKMGGVNLVGGDR